MVLRSLLLAQAGSGTAAGPSMGWRHAQDTNATTAEAAARRQQDGALRVQNHDLLLDQVLSKCDL
jgi:hypothetical protein